ncbi:MAG: DUF86 domain-containing protein [Alphaproteobacteria bacterium]|nr:DUF86 domain-containing protein [Alphaproteobacteria bacterium]
MIEACRRAMDFVHRRQRDDLDHDQLLLFALVRALEIVGEAAGRVSSETRGKFPMVPWVQIVGMRNRLVHAYFDINRDVLWRTVSREIPDLLASLEAIMGDA